MRPAKPKRCDRNWGAHASGVWFAASRHKLGLTILPKQPVGPVGGHEADGGTPPAARETRALPFSNCVIPVKSFP